jgi:hypothetical protein
MESSSRLSDQFNLLEISLACQTTRQVHHYGSVAGTATTILPFQKLPGCRLMEPTVENGPPTFMMPPSTERRPSSVSTKLEIADAKLGPPHDPNCRADPQGK